MGLYRPTYRNKKTGETKKSRVWWYAFVENGKKIRINLEVSERTAAKVKAGKIAEQRAKGKRPTKAFVHSLKARPLELIDEYEIHLRDGGASSSYVATTVARLRRMFEGVDRVAHMDPDAIRETLARIAAEPCSGHKHLRRTGPPSPRTRNYYRTALSGFFSHLVGTGRLDENPVKKVRAESTKGSKVRKRRAATFDELAKLLNATPDERRLVYLVAATAGLRRSELVRLRAKHVNLVENVLELTDDMTKNGEEAQLPLLPEVAQELAALLAGAGPEDPVFVRRSKRPSKARLSARSSVPIVRTFYDDLRGVGIEPVVAGRVLDFHGLRASLATGLERVGVSPVVKKALMRHTLKRDLTDHYTKVDLTDTRPAIARLGQALRDAGVRLGPKLGPDSDPLTDLAGLRVTNEEGSEGPYKTNAERVQRSASLEFAGLRGERDSNPQPPDRQRPGEPVIPRPAEDDLVRNLVQIPDHDEPAPRPPAGPKPAGGTADPEATARQLLALAVDASDPGPLLAAATQLLETAAKARQNVLRLEDERRKARG